MSKKIAEKAVVGVAALGLLVLSIRAVRLLWTSAVLARKGLAKDGGDDRGGNYV